MATFHEIETEDLPADGAPSWDERRLPPGVPRIFLGLAALAVVTAIPYFAADLERFRAWVPGEAVPFAKLFRTDVEMKFHGAGAGADPEAGLVESEKEALAATAALDDADEPVEAPAIAVITEPAPAEADPAAPADTALADAGADAPKAEGDKPAPPTPRIVIPPETYAGVEVLIEDPHGAMDSVYRSLRDTALKKPDAITRIAHWGDSAIGADGMTSVTRRLLQREFGDSGHGFILVESGTDWYLHKDIRYGQAAWKAIKIIDAVDPRGRYGYGGVQSRGYQGANAWFATVTEGPVGRNVGRFDILYQTGPKYGDLSVTVDEGEPTILSTAADEIGDELHTVRVPDGPHKLTVRVAGGGVVRLYGVILEREQPGVVYDSMGLVGARGQRLLNADPDHWKRQLELRRPNMMILMYGGNELVDRGMNMERYRGQFTELVHRFRASRPDATCLIMSPLDHGERDRGRIRTDPQLLKMMVVQREVALAEGCAWYSVFDAMGGEGSMGRWFRSEPRLGWGDLAHPTKEGSRVLGDRFYRAIMKGFSDWLERNP
ncbi:MAG: GDSL-type esterase/lipase family protein [Myxococcota bacterium]